MSGVSCGCFIGDERLADTDVLLEMKVLLWMDDLHDREVV